MRKISLSHVKGEAFIWGDWQRQEVTGLGYGSETAISRLLTSPGRSTRRDYSPEYKQCPRAQRFDDAWQQIDKIQQVLIFCRFVLQMSDARICERETTLKSEGAARWQVEKALKALVPLL